MRAQTSENMGRGARALVVIALHLAVIYAIATALGVIRAPSLIKPMEAMIIDSPAADHQEKPVVMAKPQMVQPSLDVPVTDPTPQIEEPVETAVTPPDAAAISDANLQVTRRVDPDYPAASRRAGEHGTAEFSVLVDATGHPQDIKVVTSSGYDRLDQSAMQAIHRWIFNPAVRGSQKVTAWTTVRVTFKLQNG